MRCREIHRRKEAGIEDEEEYIVPNEDTIVKMSDIEKELLENDEFIDEP